MYVGSQQSHTMKMDLAMFSITWVNDVIKPFSRFQQPPIQGQKEFYGTHPRI